ncbi:phosphoglycerate mutase-like protein [Microthyrium microscopicum]|uniref:Phosphoglycerate mutase-like protein n=1 Tax=Microthyrium microscopicum TaxID=703497 RepID=A0A6A6UE83_9PEZI|nr:phosphoglycerate mutase-like protein [Microthyrium microscopicum]
MIAFGTTVVLSAIASVASSQDTVYAVYMFHRHGDRTSKATPPTSLTVLGYDQVISSGTYYNKRYVDASSPNYIAGLSTSLVKNSQIAVSAPADTVLQNSANGFLQGLYPPVGFQTDTLANGTTLSAPMNGYQLIPIGLTSNGAGSENNGWLQDASGCANAVTSSNNYFFSKEYQTLLNSTGSFFTRLDPVTNRTFADSYMTYKNAYSIFDLINVARIHNKTIQSDNLLDAPTVLELQVLANQHELGLAYNASDNARAVPGMQLAGEIVTFLNNSITTKGASKFGIQFGSYNFFMSFFGLANLTSVNANFTGIPDYASSMVMELFGPNSTSYPSPSDLKVRFLYSNVSTGISGGPVAYPLFGGSALEVSWTDFQNNMSSFGIESTAKWCSVCGNTTGVCASSSGAAGASGSSSSSSTSGSHMSNAVAGVIGAMVTLAVILGLEALVALIAGLRVVKKGKSVPANGSKA